MADEREAALARYKELLEDPAVAELIDDPTWRQRWPKAGQRAEAIRAHLDSGDDTEAAAVTAMTTESVKEQQTTEGLEGDGTGDELSEDGVRTNLEKNADDAAEAARQAVKDADDAEDDETSDDDTETE